MPIHRFAWGIVQRSRLVIPFGTDKLGPKPLDGVEREVMFTGGFFLLSNKVRAEAVNML